MKFLFILIIGIIGLSSVSTAADVEVGSSEQQVPLAGVIPVRDSMIDFQVKAETTDKGMGGSIIFGDIEYEISKMSRLGLIGARRFVSDNEKEKYAEFLILSSSFSDQMAVGDPWPKTQEKYGCTKPYNTYVAFYRVEGEELVKSLGPIPYSSLLEDLSLSQHSWVSCSIIQPRET